VRTQDDEFVPGGEGIRLVTISNVCLHRIPEIIQSEGLRPVTNVLDGASYRVAPLVELIEEAQETSHTPADDLLGGSADVLEVLHALTVPPGMSWPRLLALAEDKCSRHGSFGKGSSSNQWNEAAARSNRSPNPISGITGPV